MGGSAGAPAPRYLAAEASPSAPSPETAAAAPSALPARLSAPDRRSSRDDARLHPRPPMQFSGSACLQDETSAQTLLALGELDVEVAARKRRRVASAQGTEHAELGWQESGEDASAGEADGHERGSDSGVEQGATTGSSVTSNGAGGKARKRPLRIRKHRKATHTVRKEEKEQLQRELNELNERMLELQRRALNLSAESEDEQSAEEKATSHNVLCHLLRRQQLEFSTIRKLVSESTASMIRGGSPIQQTIYLQTDPHLRRELLARIKDSKLKDGRAFLHSRLPEVDVSAPMDEEFRFESPEGDFYACQFSIIQFECSRDVRQVFDQLIYCLCNVEISVSERVGHLTIREDDDTAADGIAQNKIVSTTVHGVKMESNAVVFSEFYDEASPSGGANGGRGSGEYGVIVMDFVDCDDRHPYRPTERIRRDTSSVMEVRSHWHTTPDGQREEVVVLIRWAHWRLRRPEFAVSRAAWIDLRDNMDIWSKNMHKVIMEGMMSAPTSCAPTTALAIAPVELHQPLHQPRQFSAALPWT